MPVLLRLLYSYPDRNMKRIDFDVFQNEALRVLCETAEIFVDPNRELRFEKCRNRIDL